MRVGKRSLPKVEGFDSTTDVMNPFALPLASNRRYGKSASAVLSGQKEKTAAQMSEEKRRRNGLVYRPLAKQELVKLATPRAGGA